MIIMEDGVDITLYVHYSKMKEISVIHFIPDKFNTVTVISSFSIFPSP